MSGGSRGFDDAEEDAVDQEAARADLEPLIVGHGTAAGSLAANLAGYPFWANEDWCDAVALVLAA